MQYTNQIGQWLGLAAACVLAGATASAATTYYVATNGSDSTGAGTLANPWLTISNGVRWATTAGDVVLVSNGTYHVTTYVTIASGISVLGFSGHPGDVIVDGQDATWCFFLNHTNALLAHVTITNGKSTGDFPGGVYVRYGVMSNCVVTCCEAPNGGGAHIFYGTVVTSTIACNDSTNFTAVTSGGGGVLFRASAAGRLLDSHIIGNTASNIGGGVNALSAGAFVSNCVIRDNYAAVLNSRGGGGLANVQYIYDSLIISNRTAGGDGGGGVQTRTVNSLISGCIFTGNEAMNIYGTGNADGGAIDVADGMLTLRNSTLTGNIATNGTLGRGGAIFLLPAAGRTNYVENCVISNNIAKTGGGISVIYRTIISNSIIKGNTATVSGAGVHENQNAVSNQLWNCLITDNNGIGVQLEGKYCGVYNCLISKNTRGVHTHTVSAGIVVENCTIVSNSDYGIITYSSNHVIRNTIIYGTTPGVNWQNAGTVVTYAYCATTPTNGLPGAGVGNIEADPLFVESTTGNYRLTRGSPCLNAGLNQSWMANTRDLDGHRRISIYGRVDMGAYEYLLSGTLFSTH